MRLPILWLEADQEPAAVSAKLLRHAGSPITAASGTADALKQLKDVFASIVLLVDLNDSACHECLVAVRRSAPHSWLIVFTGHAMSDNLTVARQLGADALLAAPCGVQSACATGVLTL